MATPTGSVAPALAVELPDDAAGILAAARRRRAAADAAEAELLALAVQWAVIHPAETLDDAESFTPRSHLWSGTEEPITLAGPGAPLVREFCVAEFAAAVGMGTESGKYYLGQAIELRYRLPKLWARVMAGDLPAWRARRVAHETIGHELSREAAAFVDAHVAPVAHRIRPGQLQRLVEEAMGRYMPDQAEARRTRAADRRRFDVDTDQISFDGTATVAGELDLADALDLEDAVRAQAERRRQLGSTEPLDVRRAAALGDLARRQLALDLTTDPDSARADGDRDTDSKAGSGHDATARAGRARRVRRTVLFLHLSQAAVEGHGGIGRVENTRTPVTAEQIRAWCGSTDTHLVVQPVIDLAEHVHVEAYEVPDRIAEPVALRDITCVFPNCTRPARRLRPDQHRTDCDHIRPYARGGRTCTCQIAPECRPHHRLKTHGGWRLQVLEPGSYLWTSPHGYQYLRDHRGTLDVSADKHPDPPADRRR